MALCIGIIPTETPILHEKLNIYISGKHGAIIKTATMEPGHVSLAVNAFSSKKTLSGPHFLTIDAKISYQYV